MDPEADGSCFHGSNKPSPHTGVCLPGRHCGLLNECSSAQLRTSAQRGRVTSPEHRVRKWHWGVGRSLLQSPPRTATAPCVALPRGVHRRPLSGPMLCYSPSLQLLPILALHTELMWCPPLPQSGSPWGSPAPSLVVTLHKSSGPLAILLPSVTPHFSTSKRQGLAG